MRYYTVLVDNKEVVAVSLDGTTLYELEMFKDMNELISNGGISGIPKKAKALENYTIISPIPRPRQDVVCLGVNYAAHAVESARFHKDAFIKDKPFPIFFSKRVNYSQGTNASIPSYEGLTEQLDYECELAVIVSKDAKNVKREDAGNYIFGYTILNDVTARDLQIKHKQWYYGKSLDGFTPMGPCIVSCDEISYPPVLDVKSIVNGEVRQNSNTSLLLTDIGEIFETLTEGMTLQKGTIIATGTPAGVGMGMTPPTFLKKGDVVECQIEKIGSLVNTVE